MLRAEKNKKLHVGSCKQFHICVAPLSLINYVQEQVCSIPANAQSQQIVLATSALFPIISSYSGNHCCCLE